MTKLDICREAAKKNGVSIDTAIAVFDEIMKGIYTAADTNPKGIQIRGFGTFRMYRSPERQGLNPSSGKIETFPAIKRLKFRCVR